MGDYLTMQVAGLLALPPSLGGSKSWTINDLAAHHFTLGRRISHSCSPFTTSSCTLLLDTCYLCLLSSSWYPSILLLCVCVWVGVWGCEGIEMKLTPMYWVQCELSNECHCQCVCVCVCVCVCGMCNDHQPLFAVEAKEKGKIQDHLLAAETWCSLHEEVLKPASIPPPPPPRPSCCDTALGIILIEATALGVATLPCCGTMLPGWGWWGPRVLCTTCWGWDCWCCTWCIIAGRILGDIPGCWDICVYPCTWWGCWYLRGISG